MLGLNRVLKTVVGVLLTLFLVVGCTRPLIPSQSPAASFSAPPELTGRVLFGSRTVQADMREVATSATVSLIDAATNVTLSSSVTNADGIFSLKFANTFRPSKTTAYFLEAVKGLSVGGDSNRAGASIARVRTLIYWRSGMWKSLTRDGLIVNRSTTSLSILANLHAAASLPVDTEALIASVVTDIADKSLTPPTPDTFSPGASHIAKDAYHQVFALVDEALAKDADPVFSISMDMGPPLRYFRSERGFAVSGVSPASGVSHDIVTFTGYAFDPVPANNLVKFNGWPAKVLEVSPDGKTLKVEVPRRTGLSGNTSVQVGGVLKVGPSWTQTGWQDPFSDFRDYKNTLNTNVTNGALVLQGASSLGFTDTTAADFAKGQTGGLSVIGADPIDGGDGAVKLGITALRVLQVYPYPLTGIATQIAVAQGVYTYKPDLFDIELLPIGEFNKLVTLDDTFTVTLTTKSSQTAPATAAFGGTAQRKLRDYDIIYFGIADSYEKEDLVPATVALTRTFAQLGRGVIFTHDTLPSSKTHFFSLSDLHGLMPGGSSYYIGPTRFTTVYRVPGIDTTSPVVTKPFNIAERAEINILLSHSSSHQIAPGTNVWYAFDVSAYENAANTPYWTTKTTDTSNAAFFSYGHTVGTPAEFEAKAMINSMYYTYDRGHTITGTYTSQAFDSGAAGYAWKDTTFSWVAQRANAAATISFQVAATNDPNATELVFKGPDGTAATSFTSPGASLPALTGRYLRYRVTLSTNSIADAPLLSRVDIGSTFATATSVAIAPNSISRWMTASFDATPADGLRVQFLDQNGNLLPDLVLPGNSAGFGSSPIDLSALPANNNSALRMRLTLLKQAVSPKVDNLRIDWAP